MRDLKLAGKFASFGAEFCEINGAQAVKSVAGFAQECDALRKGATLTDFSFVRRFVYDESDGLDFLDGALAQNILKLRYGRIVDTFLASEDGEVAAECFVANIDDKVYVVAENIACDSRIDGALLQGCPSAKDITCDTVLLSVDGPEAWRVAKDVCGQDIMNLPYLSIESYDFEGERIQLMRNGKTGEFGYQFLAPVSVAEKLFDALKLSLDSAGGVLCGVDSVFNARLEGNFFNIYAEGAVVKDPVSLGIQWMIDMQKDSFPGSDAIFARRQKGACASLAGVKGANPSVALPVGGAVFAGGRKVGDIVSSGFSRILNAPIALVLFERKYALAGFDYSTSPDGDLDVSTVSMPPIIPLSLQNGLDA